MDRQNGQAPSFAGAAPVETLVDGQQSAGCRDAPGNARADYGKRENKGDTTAARIRNGDVSAKTHDWSPEHTLGTSCGPGG